MTDDKPNSRRILLADTSRDVGRTWAMGMFDDLQRDGRAVSGGWPGTMSEARGRARVFADAALSRQSLPPITHVELAEAARVTYDSAKALWFGSRVRDEGVA
jgi:hypothetical protein